MPSIFSLNSQLNYSWKWGVIIFGTLTFLSTIFFRERIGFLDNAFQLFLIIQEGRITIMADRWPDVINRILPFLGLKIGLSLKSLMLLFSISYPLLQFLLYVFTYLIEKQRIWSIMSIGCLTLAVSDSFYWCSSELIHGLCWLMLLMALFYRNEKVDFISWVGIISISIICIYLHPLLIFPFGFIIIYQIIYTRQFSKNAIILFVMFSVLWAIKSQLLGNWYDDYKNLEFIQNFDKYKLVPWAVPVHKTFIFELFTKYQVFLILLILNGIWMISKNKIYALSFLVASLMIYIQIIHLGNPDATNSFYREVAYLPVTVFLLFPLLLKYFDSAHSQKLLIGFIIILFISFVRIYTFHSDYTQRNKWILETSKNTSCTNWIVEERKLDSNIFKMNWALPYESLILSTSQNLQSITIKSSQKIEEELANAKNKQLFLNPFKPIEIESLNKQNFNLSSSPYCKLE